MGKFLERVAAAARAFVHGPEMANWGIDAARYDDGWAGASWPTLNSRHEYDEMDRQTMMRRARMLECNCPPITMAVLQMLSYTGVMKPLPRTSDEEWNELARAAFLARTKNPFTFDLAGRVNFAQAQDFLERWAIIDGDVGMVPTIGADGGAMFAFYKAPQIAGGGQDGVEVDRHGRAVAYYLLGEDGSAVRLEAWQMVLYSHTLDPTRLRGVSELRAAVRHAQDIRSIVGYNKAGIKLASQMGLVETSDVAASKGSLDMEKVATGGGKRNRIETPEGPRALAGTGLSITRLLPGHRLSAIADNRPSQQVMQFLEMLVGMVAWSVGLDAEMLFYGQKLGSAAVRVDLEKLKAWQRRRREDKEVALNRIWTQVIACEVAAGRLRGCRDRAWKNVLWVAPRDMSIDLGRETDAHIKLGAKGLDDLDAFCLATHGKTYVRLLEEKAYQVGKAKEIAAAHGLDVSELIEAAPGAVTVPGGKAGAAPEDDDPEEA